MLTEVRQQAFKDQLRNAFGVTLLSKVVKFSANWEGSTLKLELKTLNKITPTELDDLRGLNLQAAVGRECYCRLQ